MGRENSVEKKKTGWLELHLKIPSQPHLLSKISASFHYYSSNFDLLYVGYHLTPECLYPRVCPDSSLLPFNVVASS
jgi:hypothetical protein